MACSLFSSAAGKIRSFVFPLLFFFCLHFPQIPIPPIRACPALQGRRHAPGFRRRRILPDDPDKTLHFRRGAGTKGIKNVFGRRPVPRGFATSHISDSAYRGIQELRNPAGCCSSVIGGAFPVWNGRGIDLCAARSAQLSWSERICHISWESPAVSRG